MACLETNGKCLQTDLILSPAEFGFDFWFGSKKKCLTRKKKKKRILSLPEVESYTSQSQPHLA